MSKLEPVRQNPKTWWSIAGILLGTGFFSTAIYGLITQGVVLGVISALSAWRAASAPMRYERGDRQDD